MFKRTRWGIPAFWQITAAVLLILGIGTACVLSFIANLSIVGAIAFLGVCAAGYFVVDGINTNERADAERHAELIGAAVVRHAQQAKTDR